MTDVVHGVAVGSRRLRIALLAFAGIVGVLIAAALVTNRNFWFDEAMVYQAITLQDFAGPGQPLLNYEQTLPYGTYVLQWIMIQLFGLNENVLRIPQLIAYALGLFAIFRAGRTIRGTTGRVASLVAGGLGFAVVTQAAEFKHYIYEYAAAAVILALGVAIVVNEYRARYVYVFALVSAAVLPFSNTAVFVTVAVVAATLIIGWSSERVALRQALKPYLLGGGGYLLVFVAYYLAVIRPAAEYQLALPYYADSSLGTLLLGVLRIFAPTNKPLYLIFGMGVFFVIATGLVLIAKAKGVRTIDRDWYPYLVLLLALAAMAAASVVGFAPFSQPRHVLFLAPAIGLAFGAAVDQWGQLLSGRFRTSKPLAAVVMVLCVVIGLGFVGLAGVSALSRHEEVGRVLAAADAECSEAYVLYSYQPAAEIYQDRDQESIQLDGLVPSRSGLGSDSWLQRIRDDIQAYEAAAVDYFRSVGTSCLLSGPDPATAQMIKALTAAGISCQLLVARVGSGMYRCTA